MKHRQCTRSNLRNECFRLIPLIHCIIITYHYMKKSMLTNLLHIHICTHTYTSITHIYVMLRNSVCTGVCARVFVYVCAQVFITYCTCYYTKEGARVNAFYIGVDLLARTHLFHVTRYSCNSNPMLMYERNSFILLLSLWVSRFILFTNAVFRRLISFTPLTI